MNGEPWPHDNQCEASPIVAGSAETCRCDERRRDREADEFSDAIKYLDQLVRRADQ